MKKLLIATAFLMSCGKVVPIDTAHYGPPAVYDTHGYALVGEATSIDLKDNCTLVSNAWIQNRGIDSYQVFRFYTTQADCLADSNVLQIIDAEPNQMPQFVLGGTTFAGVHLNYNPVLVAPGVWVTPTYAVINAYQWK